MRRLRSLTLLVMLLPGPVRPQAVQTGIVYLNQLDFSRYPTVDLYATMVDRNRGSIPRAAIDRALTLLHKGVAVELTEIQSVIDLKQKGESELYLAMIFDNSFSMHGRTALLETAASQFIDSLKAGDYVALFDFGDGTLTAKIPEFPRVVTARARTPFSNSKPFLHKAIRTGIMTDRTFMYDALLLALSTLHASSVLGRKAVILFSDGEDIGSVVGADKIREVIRTMDIPVYAIDLSERENPVLKDLAAVSGGEYFYVRAASDLASLYQTILRLLKSQYRISYRSPEVSVSGDAYSIQLALESQYRGRAQRTFIVDGENIGFYNLVYLETTGGESLRNYLSYLSTYPASKHADQVRLRIGRYWHKRGEYARALAVFNMILRNPASSAQSEALLEKAELHTAARQFKSAQEAYHQVLTGQVSGSVRARALLELAKSYTAEGNFAMALNTYSTLSSQYEGTELASEAFLQSAALSMEMGDLPAAEKNLEQVVLNYGESRSAVYARIELAKIAENQNRKEEAIRLYRDVIASHVDSDIKEDLTFRLANLLAAAGNFGEAIGLYQSLAETAVSPALVSAARAELVPVLLSQARRMEARAVFESLPAPERTAVTAGNSTISLANGGTALVNGATIAQPLLADGTSPLRMITWPEASGKFSIVGPLYSLSGSLFPARVSLPVEQAWLDRRLVVPGTAGIYHFDRGNWVTVTKHFDPVSRAYDFDYTVPGVYALLATEPKVIRLFNIYFDLGKASIRKEAERNLYEIIDALKSLPDVRLEIAGHTDSTGREEENIDLSSRRANAIKDFMVLNGIASPRLIARGYGSQYPIAPNDSPENLQKNRRSEFTIISTLADPIQKTAELVRYTVFLKSFRSAKDAYEEKRIYLGRGFPATIVTGEATGARYELTLGTYERKEEAEKLAESFAREFKNIVPRIVTASGIR